jgi:hypothetical protein
MKDDAFLMPSGKYIYSPFLQGVQRLISATKNFLPDSDAKSIFLKIFLTACRTPPLKSLEK